MSRFGTLPAAVPAERTFAGCAPRFAAAVRALLADLEGGPAETVFETLRTPARQAYLYGFGRDYDDGRGIVTHAPTSLTSWHGFGMACDIVEKDGTPWDAPPGFWDAIGNAARRHGLLWGGSWAAPKTDRPHLQFLSCPVSPNDETRAIYAIGGLEAVWRRYGAI